MKSEVIVGPRTSKTSAVKTLHQISDCLQNCTKVSTAPNVSYCTVEMIPQFQMQSNV